MNKADEIYIEVTADGTIKSATDKIGASNHSNAEGFLREMARLAGGATVTAKNPKAHGHSHSHDHEHDHEHNHN